MEKELLTDENVFPNLDIIEKNLDKNQFTIYLHFLKWVDSSNLMIEWRFYRDTKTWLGKILSKKKNIGWLSIWNVGFKITVFFTEKTFSNFETLSLNNSIDVFTNEVKPVGKLLPIRVTINNDSILNDIIKILELKKGLK